MKIRGYDKRATEIKLQMTPLIDIVFQLLVFFIMTYKVTAMEGDYNIKMPLAAEEQTLTTETLEDVLMVKLNADSNRNLVSMDVKYGMEEKRFVREGSDPASIFNSLRSFVIGAVAGSGDPTSGSDVEAEIESSFELRYEETVRAIESLSGYKTDDGQIIKLIEKIKFRDAR